MEKSFSRHASERAGKRRISVEDVKFVLRYGTEFYGTGKIRDFSQALAGESSPGI